MSVASQATTRPRLAEWRPPTRISSVLFAGKTAAFQLRRALADLTSGVKRHSVSDDPAFAIGAAQSVTALWSDENLAERALQLGKVQNLRRAVRALDGVVIPAGRTFSFWKQVGRATVARGFVKGRMLREGCMVPATGGGLCQLSNALYDVALQAGCEVVERHAHSRIVPGSAAAYGRDATVAWNYVDLRFRPREALRLEARLDRDSLVVRLLGRSAAPAPAPSPDAGPVSEADAARSCASCDETDCFLHEHGARAQPPVVGRTAFLVDEAWPEFLAHVARVHAPQDVLGLPIDGTRMGLARYRFPTEGYARVGDAALAGALRALAIRRAPRQGPARRRAELDGAERVALGLARLLGPEVSEVVVAQSLLPALWRAGHLGGRGFSVLMTRLPMTVLQARLDAAFAAHPDRRTL
ncbi:MAG TPA: VanW family protein, partial [Caulobacteraceae bacterium]|nr:VanW family protein [Caulobacteraceae bacterium]